MPTPCPLDPGDRLDSGQQGVTSVSRVHLKMGRPPRLSGRPNHIRSHPEPLNAETWTARDAAKGQVRGIQATTAGGAAGKAQNQVTLPHPHPSTSEPGPRGSELSPQHWDLQNP